jgi:hypothetical protein
MGNGFTFELFPPTIIVEANSPLDLLWPGISAKNAKKAGKADLCRPAARRLYSGARR